MIESNSEPTTWTVPTSQLLSAVHTRTESVA